MNPTRWIVAPVVLVALIGQAHAGSGKALRMLHQIETVDGAGSRLDADTLHGMTPGQVAGRLAFMNGIDTLAPNSAGCVSAACASADRVVSCGASPVDATAQVVTAVTGFRHPEDDPSNLIAADTCFACFGNPSSTASVTIRVRAVCAVGGKGGALIAPALGEKADTSATEQYRALAAHQGDEAK